MLLPPIALELPAFVLGLLFGSFLNVCIVRLPAKRSVVQPGSACQRCGAPVRWYDNLPLLSWTFLRGRCRACGERISWQYPLVELAIGCWFLLGMHRLLPLFAVEGPAPLPGETVLLAIVRTIAFMAIGWLLIGLLVIDWRTQTLPNVMTVGGLAIAFFLLSTQTILLGPGEGDVHLGAHHVQLSSPGNVVDRGTLFLTGTEALLGGRLLATVCAAAVLLLLRWIYRLIRGHEGLGLGDVKLLAMIAAFLGFSPAMLSLFFGVVAGGAYGAWLLATRRANGRSRVPLGSFLAGGGLLVAVYGQQILGWYKGLL